MSRHRNIANIFFDGTRRHKSAALVAGLALNSSMALAQGRIQALIASAHQASESSIFADVSQVIPATITRSVPSFPVLHSDSEFKKIIAGMTQDQLTDIDNMDDQTFKYFIDQIRKFSEQGKMHLSQLFIVGGGGNFGFGISNQEVQDYAKKPNVLLAQITETKYLYLPHRKGKRGVETFFSQGEIFPETAQYLLVHGSIYERKSQGYFKGTGQGQKKLELYRGMPFQILPPKFIRAHGSSDTAAKIINEEIAELQKSKFSEKFASQYQQAATLFGVITKKEAPIIEVALDIAARIHPDGFTTHGPAFLSERFRIKAEKYLGRTLGNSLEDKLLIFFSTFVYEVAENSTVKELIGEIEAANKQNAYADRERDIALSTQASMFLVLTQHNPILEIPQTELQATYPYVKARISREPTQQELQQAYLNYRILRDLDKKGMLPDSIAVERDALLSFGDIQNYLGEMAVFHGFEYFKETSPTILTRKRSATELVDTTLSFVKRLYSAFSSTGGYTESRGVTYCVARAAEGLRRSLGVNIGRHGDAHEIISGGLEQYARKIQGNLEKFQQSDRYNGFDTDFGSKHFHIPRGTTGGIIFIDTRPTGKHGNRLPIKGHAAGFVVAPDGKIIIFDPYYQGKSNSPARDIADYLSENSGKKFHSFIRDSKNRIGAVFFKGDPKNFLK